MEKNNFFIKRIRELANISYQRDIATFSDFLNLNEQNLIKMERFPGVSAGFYGGYDHAERVIAAFHPPTVDYEWTYPISCLRIANGGRDLAVTDLGDGLGHGLGDLLNRSFRHDREQRGKRLGNGLSGNDDDLLVLAGRRGGLCRHADVAVVGQDDDRLGIHLVDGFEQIGR